MGAITRTLANNITTGGVILPSGINNTSISNVTALPAGVGGKVLQVVTATDSTERTTTSTSFVTGSNTLSVNITPSSASNKIFVTASFSYQTPNGTANFETTLFRDSTNLGDSSRGFGLMFDGSSYELSHATPQVLDSPNTTSEVTYQVYFKAGAGTAKINTQGAFSTITAYEIAG